MAFMAKTELRAFYFKDLSGAKTGCQRGAKCQYAHSVNELRVLSGQQRSRGLHSRIVFDGETPPPGHEWVAGLAVWSSGSSSEAPMAKKKPRKPGDVKTMPHGVKRTAQTAFLSTLLMEDEAKLPLHADARECPPTLVWSGGGVKFYLAGISAVRVGGMLRECDLIVDCMGYDKQREWDTAAILSRQPVVIQFPWNHAVSRSESLAKLYDALVALSEDRGTGDKTALFFCKMGERRSAAVLACALCVAGDFHPSAAKAQVEARRPGAKISEEPDRRHDAAYPAVVQTVDQFNHTRARWPVSSASSSAFPS